MPPLLLTTSPAIGMPVLTDEVPEQSTQLGDVPRRRRRRRTLLAVTLVAVLVAFCGLTARLFVFPASGMPAHVDAIVMMNGPDGAAGSIPRWTLPTRTGPQWW